MTAFTQDHTTVKQGVCCGPGIGTTTFRQKYLGLYPPATQTEEITSFSLSEVTKNITEVSTGCVDFI